MKVKAIPLLHKTSDGREIPLSQLTESHIRNIIRRNLQIAEDGLTVRGGGGGWDSDCWTDELEGEAALKHLNHDAYVRELERRAFEHLDSF